MDDNLAIVQFSDASREPSDLLIDWVSLSDGINDTWADWLPFLVFGVPYVQIAKIFGVDKSAITHAINGNKDFARRIAQGRKMVKRQLHYVWLDQKAVAAWRNIDYFLSLDPLEIDDEGKYVVKDAGTRRMMFQEKAKMTRFVLQQLGLHVQKYEVTHNVPQPMFMGDQTLASFVVDRVRSIVNGEDSRDVDVIAAEFRDVTDEYEEFTMTEEESNTERPYDRKSAVHGFTEEE